MMLTHSERVAATWKLITLICDWHFKIACALFFFFSIAQLHESSFVEILQPLWQMNKNSFYNPHKYVSALLQEYWFFPTDNLGALVKKITIEIYKKRLLREPFQMIVVDLSMLFFFFC